MENVEKRHNLTIDGRKRGLVTGVEKVVSASPSELCLITHCGGLTLKGKELKISAYSEETGTLSFDGVIDKAEYDRTRQPFLKRLFK